MIILDRKFGHEERKEIKNMMDEKVTNTEAYKCKSRLRMNTLKDEKDVER